MMKKTLLSLFALSASLVGFAANPNPFAYAVSGEYDALILDVAYSLNTDADKAEVQILKNGTVVKIQEVSATAGENTAEIDLSGLADGDYTWQIAVTGGATTGNAVEFVSLDWNHPRGVDTDRNFESPAFGNIYVTEGRPTATTSYYTCTSKGGGSGLYIFTPDLTGVKNKETGLYAFMGGLTVDRNIAYQKYNTETKAWEDASTTNGADLSRVRVAEDGRIFVTRLNDSGSYICVAKNAEELIENNTFTSLLGEGSISELGFYNANNEFIAGPNYAFDIYGSGEDLKIATLAAMNALWSYDQKGSYAHEYELGENNILPLPTELTGLHAKFTAAAQSTSIAYDNRGGIWYSQYRDNHTDTNPSLVYIDENGEQKFFNGAGAAARYSGGIRFSPDYKQIVMGTSLRSFTIYDVSYATDGTPTLTENLVVSYTYDNKNINDFAWDLAGNIYAVSNGGEYVKGFAVPRADNTFATKAASKYNFTVDTATGVETIGADNAPVEYYNLQGVKVENPENGIFIKKQGNKAVKVIL